jgi:hypothetical protein
MTDPALRPLCFVAMPFGRKAPPGKRAPLIDFDRVYRAICDGVEAAGLECVRADFEKSGGLIQRPMFERLLVAEFVVADLTLANPNVLYEVGVRHGATARSTLLLCAGDFAKTLPFDVAPLRALPYDLTPKGSLGKKAAADLTATVRDRLRRMRKGELPSDNPILQVTAWRPAGALDHQKTDAFIGRMSRVTEVGKEVADALAAFRAKAIDAAAARAQLDAIAGRVASDDAIEQLHSTLVSLFLGYREISAWDAMTALYDKLPRELQQTPMAREQLALAQNRLAEQAEKRKDAKAAAGYRSQALRTVEQIPAASRSSETWGIVGRIYKGWATAESARDAKKSAEYRKRAIESYETGFRADPRDYYPGVNAVTLRLERNEPADREALAALVPVVRFSVDRAPEPIDDMERYWQTATKLELDCAARDWPAAEPRVQALRAIPAAPWMHDTTRENLERQRAVLADAGDVAAIEGVIAALK